MRCLGLFAKYWQPGRVKSRLAESIGAAPAADLYQTFRATLLGRLAGSADRRVLAYTPAERHDRFHQLLAETMPESWTLEPQPAGDLGARMRRFFDTAFAAGASHVVLIGSDSPNLPIPFVDQAFVALEQSPVVLGPTTDGGYYLVGARDATPPIFDEIAWSSPSVWQQTVDRLDALSITYRSLPRWYDVDDLTDLRRLSDDLSRGADTHPALKLLRDGAERILRARV